MKRKTVIIVASLLFVLTVGVVYLIVNSGNLVVVHELGITDVEPSRTHVYIGEIVDIHVVVKNKGNVNETFNVTSFYNTTEIGTQTIMNLSPNAEKSLIFAWNTSEVLPGNFVVKAKINPVPGEANTSDNSFSDGLVLVRVPPLQTAVLYLAPQTSTAQVGREFTVDVNIANVTDLYGWEIRLAYNNSVLNLTDITQKSFLRNVGTTYFTYKASSLGDTVVADCTLVGVAPGASGNGTLATIKFYVRGVGTSSLDLFNTTLVSSLDNDINHTAISGIFSTTV
jgi:hypothetical protein